MSQQHGAVFWHTHPASAPPPPPHPRLQGILSSLTAIRSQSVWPQRQVCRHQPQSAHCHACFTQLVHPCPYRPSQTVAISLSTLSNRLCSGTDEVRYRVCVCVCVHLMNNLCVRASVCVHLMNTLCVSVCVRLMSNFVCVWGGGGGGAPNK